MLLKQFPVSSFFSPPFFVIFLIVSFHLNQSDPPEITKNEVLWSLNETAHAALTRLLVSSATGWILYD